MSDLSVYLHDHLAGANFAIELLQKLESEFSTHETGIVAGALLSVVREDRQTLESVIGEVGKATFDIKDALGWLAERVSRIKLRHDEPLGIGAFEAFEVIALGILGKHALWETLCVLSSRDERLKKLDYAILLQRADHQFTRANDYRLKIAALALANG